MKRALLLAVFVVACAKPEADKMMDSAAMAGPAPLMASDLAGTWTGMIMAEGSDSVLSRFTVWSPTGTDSKTLVEGSTDTVAVTHMFDADSLVATSAVYTDPTMPNKPQVTFRAVGRMMGGKLVGTSAVMLASKPDSVLARERFEMTKSP